LSLSSSVAFGADDVKKVKRIVARLHLEMMQLKEKTSKLAGEQLALLEPQNAKIETLTISNLKLSETISALKFKISILEEKLEEYQSKSSSSQLSELNQFATILALASVGETSTLEALVLELINKGNNLQKDLLILLLAETQKNQGLIEQSLGYYGALISDYPQSPYLNRAIFEASELLGKLGHTEEQMSMLQALKESDGAYGEQARKKLE
jgi:predicted RNase H-like nuclease (RuvC/YqgF family)